MIAIPDSYRPFGVLTLCSNQLTNVRVPLAINDDPLLLIGSGHEIPLVWLSARLSTGDAGLRFVVEESRSTHLAVSVVVGKQTHEVAVLVGGWLVLRVRTVEPQHAVVDALDLRPFGLEARGDPSGLQVGTSRFTGNAFSGMGVAFAFAGSPHPLGAVAPHPTNDDLRQQLAVARQAASGNRQSVYLRDVLRNVEARVEQLRGVLSEMERLATLPMGHPDRMKVAVPEKEVASAKGALADAMDIKFQIENWMAGKPE